MNENINSWVFKPSRFQRLTNPGSAVVGMFLITIAIIVFWLGIAHSLDTIGAVSFSVMAIPLGIILIFSNLRHWISSSSFPPHGYRNGDEITISLEGDKFCYGITGSEKYILERHRIWRIRKGYFGCSIMITVEPYYFVVPQHVVKDMRFQSWLQSKK